ncbi:phytoene/squalene synthase family protein [Salisaeta longa]|uniref:phytoene/squalene synthase family protein n=1 Tax=Salisaeta longa TaxID=503170 RepID=UPI0004126F9D|nr:phytoene/squalene synthase family protein [Salisaeta longa]
MDVAASTHSEDVEAPDGDPDAYIWNAFHHHSRTFSMAARLLPPSRQLPIATLYLFCRRVDTLADERVLDVGAEQALREVAALEDRLDRTLAGHPPEALLWQRLADVHARYGLQRAPMDELIAGARFDLEGRTVETLDDLVHYSNLVGGSVGAMMLPFLCVGQDHEPLDAPARTLGIAMQITNITRDVGEDLRMRERVYLPRAWMDEAGVTVDDLRAGRVTPAYRGLMERVMEAAEERYTEGMAAIDALPWKVRLGIGSAARMYREIMNEVRRNGYDNLTERAYVSWPRKLGRVAVDTYARRKAALKDA